LAARATELLAEGGAGLIPQLLRDVAQRRSSLAEAQAREPELAARLEDARRRSDELAKLEERLSSCRARKSRSETQLRLAPQWDEMTIAVERLAAMESVDEFPAEAGERLAALRERLASTIATSQRLRRERQQLERQLVEVADDGGLGSVAESVAQLRQELTSYRSRLMALATARARHQECSREFERGLAEIGAGWGARRAVRFDLEALNEEAVHAWAERIDAVAQREREARRQLERGQADLRQLCESVAAELRDDTPLAEDPLDEKWRALWRVRAHLDELWVVQSQGEAEARSVEEKEEALRKVEAKSRLLTPALGEEGLGLMAGIAAILLLWRLSVGDMGSAVLCGMAGGALWVMRRGWSWYAQRTDVHERRLRQTAAEKLDRARQARDARWKRAAEIRAVLAHDNHTLGLPEVPSVEAVEECEQALVREGLQRRAAEGGGPRVNALVLELLDAEDRERQLSEEWRARHQELSALRAEWEIWRASAGLPDGVAAERISEWVGAVRSLKSTWSTGEQAAAEVKRLEPSIATWEQKAREVLKRGGMTIAADLCGSALVERLTVLAGRVQESVAAAAEQRRLKERLGDLTTRLANAEADIKSAREERQTLLAAAGAQDDAELDRRLQVFDQRRDLQARVEALRQSIEGALAELGDDGRLHTAVAGGSTRDWASECDEAHAELLRLEERRAQLEEQGETPERCWEALAEVPRLNGECHALQVELADAVRRWRRLVVARALIRDSLREVNRARLRVALSEASRTLARLSAGRHRSVLADENGQGLLVVDANGRRQQVSNQLDHETKENVYLSVRLGIAASAVEQGSRMPLVMDDLFARLDPARARTLVCELERLSHDRQVLVFTCDRTTCETLTQLGNGNHLVQA
jgi:uncharacterized protein YhaN